MAQSFDRIPEQELVNQILNVFGDKGSVRQLQHERDVVGVRVRRSLCHSQHLEVPINHFDQNHTEGPHVTPAAVSFGRFVSPVLVHHLAERKTGQF